MKNNEQKIEALETVIEMLQEKLAKLKDGGVTTQDGPGKDPIPPDPTHPQP